MSGFYFHNLAQIYIYIPLCLLQPSQAAWVFYAEVQFIFGMYSACMVGIGIGIGIGIFYFSNQSTYLTMKIY